MKTSSDDMGDLGPIFAGTIARLALGRVRRRCRHGPPAIRRGCSARAPALTGGSRQDHGAGRRKCAPRAPRFTGRHFEDCRIGELTRGQWRRKPVPQALEALGAVERLDLLDDPAGAGQWGDVELVLEQVAEMLIAANGLASSFIKCEQHQKISHQLFAERIESERMPRETYGVMVLSGD